MALSTFALIAISVFITALISGTFGMPGGMILMVVLLGLLPVAVAITVHATVQLVSNGWRCWLWRRHIVWKVLPVYGTGMRHALKVLPQFPEHKAFSCVG